MGQGMTRHVAIVVRWPTGGIRTYLKYVYRDILAAGWRATLIGPPQDEMEFLRRDLESLGVGYTWSAHRGGVMPSMVGSLRRLKHQSPIDVVHSNGLTAGLACSLYARMAGLPHMVTLHDVFQRSQFSGVSGVAKKQLIALGLMPIDVIQSVSHDAQENLLEFLPALRFKHKDSNIVIPNGIESASFAIPQSRDIRAECGIQKDELVIGFFGRFMAQKGFRFLVQAVQKIVTERLLQPAPVVVAVGHGGFVREEQEYIRGLGLEGRFRFLPFVPDIGPTITGCDVVAMPSLWEACPLLPMESLCAGVPLIGSSCIGLREVLDGTPAQLVPPGDAEAIKDALLAFASDREAIGRQAGDFAGAARMRYDVANTSKLLKVRLELLADRG